MLEKHEEYQLNMEDFTKLCKLLFRNADGAEYELENSKIREMFMIFDKNKDGFLDAEEFQYCWDNWAQVILRPKSALLIIDVQNDFISGTLSVSHGPAGHDGADVIAPINALLGTGAFRAPQVYYSLDWHPPDHISFVENAGLRELEAGGAAVQAGDEVVFRGPPRAVQRLWPAHCVQDTWGAQLHPQLTVVRHGVTVRKGADPDVDSYSAFYDNRRAGQTELHARLREARVTDVFVCGLAWDYCVGQTALHALELGYRTAVLSDCTRALDLQRAHQVNTQLADRHGVVLHSHRVPAMVAGRDRLPELGYKLAMDIKTAMEKARVPDV